MEKSNVYCEHCNKILGENDIYCRYCGKKATRNYNGNIMKISSILYGPPYSAKYICPKCGKVYIERGLGAPGTRYCAECGEKNKRVDP